MTRQGLLFLSGILLMLASCTKPSNEAERPNILFCIADDQSYPHAGAYGCDWVKTPSFDRIAQQGILFNRAFTPNAKCAPSRSCIVTGRNSWQLEAAANHWCYFPPKFKTYAECLIEHGYFVGHTQKGWAPGVVKTAEGERRELLGPAFNEYKTEPPTGFISNNDYAANFEAFLDSKPDGEPFCFWYGSVEPHRAYEYRSGANKAGKLLSEVDEVPPYWPDCDTVRNDMLDYALEVEYFDSHIGRMLRMLEDRDMLEHTLVIVTSDHGMPFPRVKGMPNMIANRVPLAMMWPGGIHKPGRVFEGFVSFTDFAPTFLELAGISIEESGMQAMEGQSLVPLLAGRSDFPGRDFMVFGKERTDVGRPDDAGYPARGIANRDHVYIMNIHPERWPAGNPETGYLDTDGSPTKSFILNDRRLNGESWFWQQSFGKKPAEELYNIKEDPWLLDNLAENPALQDVKEALKSQLIDELKTEGDPRMFGKGEEFDKYPYADEKNRDFYNRFMRGEQLDALYLSLTAV
jgi:N-sulfoglucosamine sulfohydrolase